MTVHKDETALMSGGPVADSEFDLDVSIMESAPVIDDLMRITSDNCGNTCESACPATGC